MPNPPPARPASSRFRLARLCALLLLTLTAHAGRQEQPIDLAQLVTPLYTVSGDAFVRHNGDHYGNRPLYANQIAAVTLGGDKPCALAGTGKTFLGNLMFAIGRPGHWQWLQNAADITSEYRPGRMTWTVRDPAWGDAVVHLDLVPLAAGAGFAARLRAENARPGDSLLWASGGFRTAREGVLGLMDMTSQAVPYMNRGFAPAECENNLVQVQDRAWTLQTAGRNAARASGHCSAPGNIIIADAAVWSDPAALLASHGRALPLACGIIDLTATPAIFWSLTGPEPEDPAQPHDPAAEFAAGLRRVTEIENRVTVQTPDPWLDAAVGASVIANDAHYRNGFYTHSGMRWSVPLLGWRTLFGGTVYGWHDRVKTDAATALRHQITAADHPAPQADPAALLTSQSPDSRLFGRGRVDYHQPHHYDMQSQFFDQLQHAWRWTGDAELEKILRPALDLHCEYIHDCFDPANLGIYESYANTWPTDDQWYNGGGTAEETAYAYASEQIALRLAQRAGDPASAQLHTATLARIRNAFFRLLWLPAAGHPGAYRDQGGLQRLHPSPWLYGIFCPIDAGLLDPEQSAQALQYTESGLERVAMPYGGEQCWPSDWVPSLWSLREMWPGDNYHLALAYFQTGLADDGWKLLRGTFPQQMLFGTVPGDTGHPAGGTDFNDCNSPFARAVVEGLFGYHPDYPAGLVKIAPQFPSDWDHAAIKTPDYSLQYLHNGTRLRCQLTLAQPAALELQLPVATTAVATVTVNGRPVPWELLPGFGRTLVKITLPATAAADVRITCQDTLPVSPAIHLAGNSGDPITLAAGDSPLLDFHDPQGVLQNARLNHGIITALLTTNAGDHLVFGLAQTGTTRRWQLFKIHVTDARADATLAAQTQVTIPPQARWETLDLQPVLNGDIRTIFQQQYLSPRPNTCSLRLATDGYSTWQQVLARNNSAPAIDLANVPALTDAQGLLHTTNGVPFRPPAGTNNIAFTSRWDNWPHQVTVPVRQNGAAVWFLLGGFTDPMDVRLPNAELRMKYADGVEEKLELTPPFNFWSLCPFGGIDYDYARDAFALPAVPPATLQLGRNCRANLLAWRLRPGVTLESVTLETLSKQVVIGLLGVTLMK